MSSNCKPLILKLITANISLRTTTESDIAIQRGGSGHEESELDENGH
jgi:hypothetical protein